MIPYRLAVLTDIHIDDKENLRYGIDTKSNLLLLFKDIKKQQIRHIIITGDLCYNTPKISTYKWIKEQLELHGFDYNIIPGNHDSANMVKEVFKMKQSFFSLNEWGKKVLFLDTSNNTLPQEQQDWIHSELKDVTKEIIIFMHHPPMLMDSLFMDTRYPLRNIDETQNLFQSINKKLTIFCGHYHSEIKKEYKNQEIYLGPSNIFQIDRKQPEFKIESYNPGWRYLEFEKNTIINIVNSINIGRDNEK